jgi:hypothetical protein
MQDIRPSQLVEPESFGSSSGGGLETTILILRSGWVQKRVAFSPFKSRLKSRFLVLTASDIQYFHKEGDYTLENADCKIPLNAVHDVKVNNSSIELQLIITSDEFTTTLRFRCPSPADLAVWAQSIISARDNYIASHAGQGPPLVVWKRQYFNKKLAGKLGEAMKLSHIKSEKELDVLSEEQICALSRFKFILIQEKVV